MRKVHADARTCYSSLKLSDLVGFLDATDRAPERTAVAAHTGVAAVEVEVVGAVAVAARSGRPIEAVAASKVGSGAVVVAVAGSREEYLRYTCCI